MMEHRTSRDRVCTAHAILRSGVAVNGMQVEVAQVVYDLLDSPRDLPRILAGAPARLANEIVWLRGLSARPTSPGWPLEQWEIWRLYAVSRLCELSRKLEYQQAGRRAGLPCHTGLMTALGFHGLPVQRFHPVLHEVVEVEPSPGDTWEIVERVWPGWRLGTLVFAREGVRARIPDGVDPDLFTSGRLYWSYAHPTRPVYDLSVGWGHNSQWRTDFRCDHVHSGRAWYNTNAREDASEDVTLSPEVAAEVLRHRCFLRPPAEPDPWLWNERLDEPVAFDLSD
jgi:hypothetical protein